MQVHPSEKKKNFFGEPTPFFLKFFYTRIEEEEEAFLQLIAGTPFTDEEEIFFGEPTPSEKNKKIIYFFSQEGK